MGLNEMVFYHFRVKSALVACDKSIRHIPTPAQVITPMILRQVIQSIQHIEDFYTVRFLFVAMFILLLRQSNFARNCTKDFDTTRQLTRGDVSIVHGNLQIKVKWEKNQQMTINNRIMSLPPNKDLFICPIQAFTEMTAQRPTESNSDPLIMFKNGSPMSLSFIRRIWKDALQSIGIAGKRTSLHGLRRGGATYIA